VKQGKHDGWIMAFVLFVFFTLFCSVAIFRPNSLIPTPVYIFLGGVLGALIIIALVLQDRGL
jgi:uncharacterized membrane protein YdcZ (DUF606 family)